MTPKLSLAVGNRSLLMGPGEAPEGISIEQIKLFTHCWLVTWMEKDGSSVTVESGGSVLLSCLLHSFSKFYFLGGTYYEFSKFN